MGPVCGGGDAFAVRGAEVEEDGETVFAEAGMLFERPAILEFYLCFGGAVDVGNF